MHLLNIVTPKLDIDFGDLIVTEIASFNQSGGLTEVIPDTDTVQGDVGGLNKHLSSQECLQFLALIFLFYMDCSFNKAPHLVISTQDQLKVVVPLKLLVPGFLDTVAPGPGASNQMHLLKNQLQACMWLVQRPHGLRSKWPKSVTSPTKLDKLSAP